MGRALRQGGARPLDYLGALGTYALAVGLTLTAYEGLAVPLERASAQLQAAAQSAAEALKAHHKSANGAPRYVNHLILEQSPYLRQHAFNPVNWRPWGPEALALAREEDKPIFLSIGYSTCHWCHVMERESFEDEEVAAFLNAHFIPIKVDREERPDLDDVYMKAVQLLTGRGGWPMTTLLTPDQEPFFGGTYFPARDGDRGRHEGLLTLLRRYQGLYQRDKQSLLRAARQLSAQVAQRSLRRPGRAVPPAEVLLSTAQRLAARFDHRYGGFGRAPKFPTPPQLTLLLDYAQRSRDPRAFEMVSETLRHMAEGGIYDQLAGGFHRYAVDGRWRVPHFEKMLYDNAQLIPLYLEAAAREGRAERAALFRRVARETLEYLLREMRSPEGLFYSATDADSVPADGGEAEEGLYFTWTLDELRATLSPGDVQLAALAYGVSARGALEGRSVLRVASARGPLARRAGLSEARLEERLAQLRGRLLKARSLRPAPLRDDKALCAWNGLTISALVTGATRLAEPRYAALASELAAALLKRLRQADGGLYRTYINGRARHLGVLDDYGALIQGLLDLFEHTGEPRWLQEARALQGYIDEHFSVEGGGYYLTSARAERLIAREVPMYDGAEPSGNALSALNLSRLHALTLEEGYHQRLEGVLRAGAGALSQGGGNGLISAALLSYYGRMRTLVLSYPSAASADALTPLVRGYGWSQLRVIPLYIGAERSRALARRLPWLIDKPPLEGKVTAYLCYEGSCERPVTSPEALRALLERVEPLPIGRSPAPLE